MGPTRPGMLGVELVELVEPDAGDVPDRAVCAEAAPTTGSAPAPDRGGRRGPARRRGVAVLAGVVLASGAGAVVSEQREAEHMAALREVPGVLEPVDAPLVEAWRSDQRLWSSLWDVDGLLIGVRDVWDGVRDVAVVALDRRTGQTRWSATVVAGATRPIGGARCVVPQAPAGGDDADRVVVCLSIDTLGPSPQDLSRLEPRSARLLVLAPATGEVLQERAVDPTTSIAGLGADLVVKDVTDDGRVRVTRTGPRGGDVRWTFAGERGTALPEYSIVRTDDDLVVVPGEAGWILTADGNVVHAWEPERPAAGGYAEVRRGRVLVQPRRDLFRSTVIVDLPTGRSFETDGYVPTLTADDGSTGDLVLVQSAQGDGLVAHEVETGRRAWSVRGEDGGGVLVLDGRVVRALTDRLQAVDARTGATVWSTPSAAARTYGLYTDGRVLVRAERDAERGVVLVGRGLDDGRLRWTSDVADDVQHLVAVDGRLYGLTPGGMVALGSPAG